MLPVAGHIIWRAYFLLLGGRIGFLKEILAADSFAVTLESSIAGQVCNGLISGLSRTEKKKKVTCDIIMSFSPEYNSNIV